MRSLNQRGFSIAEALVAAGILAVVVTGVTTMVGGNGVSDVFRGRTQATNVCLAEANTIMNNIKQKGLVRARVNLEIPESDTALAAATTVTTFSGNVLEAGITNANRWNTALPIYGAPASGVYPLRPHMEIMGYMNALQAMYNSAKTTFCPASGYGATSYAGDGTAANDIISAVSSTSGLDQLGSTTQAVTAYLKIQPFNTDTGALIACGSAPATIDIRPPNDSGVAISTTSPTSDTMKTDASSISIMKYTAGTGRNSGGTVAAFSQATTTDDRGFSVTVTIVYKDRTGQDRNCSVQEKFQYSAQPANPLRLEFSDIEDGSDAGTAITVADADETANDANAPENINRTVRMQSPKRYPLFPATYPGSGDANDFSSPNAWAPTNTMLYGCNDTNYSPDINLRLKNVRPGSIMMCRNLSSNSRPLPDTVSPGILKMNNSTYPQRNLFYSTELLQNDYFRDQEVTDSVYGDMMVMGLYYPKSVSGTSGDYYCRSTDGCDDLPRFPRGYAPGATGSYATYTTSGDTTRLYYPLTGNAAALADTTTDFVPCETISVCGSQPSFAGFVAQDTGSTSGVDAYHLQFTNLPVGCEVDIHMVEVDSGYNTKATIFREYIHEKVPGNKLCRAGINASTNIPGHTDYEWFFACRTAGTNPNTTLGTAAVDCGTLSASDITTPCCVDFPFYPPDAISGDATHNDGIYDP